MTALDDLARKAARPLAIGERLLRVPRAAPPLPAWPDPQAQLETLLAAARSADTTPADTPAARSGGRSAVARRWAGAEVADERVAAPRTIGEPAQPPRGGESAARSRAGRAIVAYADGESAARAGGAIVAPADAGGESAVEPLGEVAVPPLRGGERSAAPRAGGESAARSHAGGAIVAPAYASGESAPGSLDDAAGPLHAGGESAERSRAGGRIVAPSAGGESAVRPRAGGAIVAGGESAAGSLGEVAGPLHAGSESAARLRADSAIVAPNAGDESAAGSLGEPAARPRAIGEVARPSHVRAVPAGEPRAIGDVAGFAHAGGEFPAPPAHAGAEPYAEPPASRPRPVRIAPARRSEDPAPQAWLPLGRLALGSVDFAALAVEVDVESEPAVAPAPPADDFDALMERLVADLELEYLRLYGTGELGR